MGLYDDQLLELLGDALLQPSDDGLSQERAVVDALIKQMSSTTVTGFVRYVHGHDDSDGAVAGLIDAAGELHMAAWNGGDLLRRRFAGVALVRLLETYTGPSVVAAALAEEAEGLMGSQSAVPQLRHLASPALTRLADFERVVSFKRSPEIQRQAKSQLGDLPPEDDVPLTNRALRPYVDGLQTAVDECAQATEARMKCLEKLALRSSEEIDLLWWALRPSSPYVQVWGQANAAATLLAALEMARRMLMDPPLRGAELVLAEVLLKADLDPCESLSLSDVLQSLPLEALSDPLLAGSAISPSQPVLSSLQRRRDADNDPSNTVLRTTASRLRWGMQLIFDLSLRRVVA